MRGDGKFYLYMNDRQVMSTTLTHSELLLADIGCAFAGPRRKPRILIGGLGLGFSLRRTLELVGPDAEVVVAELLPEIERWNHECLDGLNDGILADSLLGSSRAQEAHGDPDRLEEGDDTEEHKGSADEASPRWFLGSIAHRESVGRLAITRPGRALDRLAW